MRRLITALTVVLLMSAVVGNAWGVAQYTVTDLGPLAGSDALGINVSGQVVGGKDFGPGYHGFLYSGGAMTDLGTLQSDHRYSCATDINDFGQIAGYSMLDQSPSNTLSQRPVLFSGGTVTSLGSFGGGYGFANGINNSGQVVGLSIYSSGVGHAFLYSNATMTDLGSFGGSFEYSCAYGINDHTQIVGNSVLNGRDRGFLWQSGTMIDLGDLVGGSGNTRAYAINNSAHVVGNTWGNDPANCHAFVWRAGTMIDLGPGIAEGINDAGVVAGGNADGLFVWDSANGLQNANDLLDASGAGWTLHGARDINNLGQIAGWGTNPSGEIRGVLLTPVPEPSTFVLVGTAAAALSGGLLLRVRLGWLARCSG
jgi:probable HAF family extracellular repeat protein